MPEVVDELSAERVLAMSFVSGTTIDQLCGSHVAQSVRDATAERLVRIKMKELFSWCFLNADPHLGNFVFNATTHKLGLLDFGFCKQFPRKSASHVAQLFLGCADADAQALVDVVYGRLRMLCAPVQDEDVEALRAESLAEPTPARTLATLLGRADAILSFTEALNWQAARAQQRGERPTDDDDDDALLEA